MTFDSKRKPGLFGRAGSDCSCRVPTVLCSLLRWRWRLTLSGAASTQRRSWYLRALNRDVRSAVELRQLAVRSHPKVIGCTLANHIAFRIGSVDIVAHDHHCCGAKPDSARITKLRPLRLP